MKQLPLWRILLLIGAFLLFALQVGAYVVNGRAGDPILGPLSAVVLGAAAGLNISAWQSRTEEK